MFIAHFEGLGIPSICINVGGHADMGGWLACAWSDKLHLNCMSLNYMTNEVNTGNTILPNHFTRSSIPKLTPFDGKGKDDQDDVPVLNIGQVGRDTGQYLLFLPTVNTIWENRSAYRLQQKTTDIWNVSRFSWDIIWYLLFYLLSIRYGKIVRHIVSSKKQLIFEISADKSPDISENI